MEITTEIPASGVSTDIYVTEVPKNVSIGSSIDIGNEVFTLLNTYSEKNILRVKRGDNSLTHNSGTAVTFKNYTFDIEKSIPYFDSKKNEKVYFNPVESIGIGTTPGKSTDINFNIGEESVKINVLSQSIFIKNHPFKNNQKIKFNNGGNSGIQVRVSPSSSNFILPADLYIIKKSKDTIGIKTSLGGEQLYFSTNGDNSSEYFIETTFDEEKATVEKHKATVSISTYHGLESGDIIDLKVKPSLSVGIGTSTKVNVAYNTKIESLVIEPVQIETSDIDVSENEITILNHNFKTGDKVLYENSSYVETYVPVDNYNYFVYVKDRNTVKLCETLFDTQTNPPKTIGITSIGDSSQKISLINPQIKVVKNNDLVFDLSDNSLSGYNFKVFYDKTFLNDFVSTGSTNSFIAIESGTPGNPEAKFTIKYDESLPEKIYYSLEKSGYISTADTNVNNYSEILYIDSSYNNTYSVFGIGSSQSSEFNINLKQLPENLTYSNSDCEVLSYSTSSKNATGSVSKIKIKSKGNNYDKLPIFKGTDTENGNGLSVITRSSSIGNVLESKVIDTKYEYSSDKTLRPSALISSIVALTDSNIVGFVSVTDGGSNFVKVPNLIVVDRKNRQEINNGLIKPILSGSSIKSVEISVPPKGISDVGGEIFSVNNTNGVSIKKVTYNSVTQTFDCVLTTPINGFSINPFSVNDEVFIEGIQKENSSGDGFNSKDYGYEFFVVSDYSLAADSSGADVVTIKSKSSNPGTPKTIQDSTGVLVNKKNYPIFTVGLTQSNFEIGEKIILNGANTDIIVSDYENSNSIKLFGTDNININDKIFGVTTGNLATIKKLESFAGNYTVSPATRVNEGWINRTGFLSEDYQVLPITITIKTFHML